MLTISAEKLTRLRTAITVAIGRRQNRRAIINFLRRNSELYITLMGLAVKYPTRKPSHFQSIVGHLHCETWLLNRLSKYSWTPSTCSPLELALGCVFALGGDSDASNFGAGVWLVSTGQQRGRHGEAV
jgi:hypothetical protein